MANVLDREMFKIRMQIQLEENDKPKIGKHYAMSDLHGMYGSYMEVMGKLSEDDHIFIIGDVIDRGEGGIKIISDIIERQNNNGPKVTFLLGNHEVMFLQTVNIMLRYEINNNDLKNLVENSDNFVTFFNTIKNKGVSLEEVYVINNWVKNNHGDKTIFRYLEDIGPSKMKEIYNFLLDSYVILPQKIGKEDFLFVHAMPINDKAKLEEMKRTRQGMRITDLSLSEYSFMLTERNRQTYQLAQEVGFITICGHTPNLGNIRNKKDEGFIRIDVGCGHGKDSSKLALYCIEDDAVEYIDEKREVDIEEQR